MNLNHQPVAAQVVPEENRTQFVGELFGMRFAWKLEPSIFHFASVLSADYQGGLWQFYSLSNGGFFMAPEGAPLRLASENGYSGWMSSTAMGITACLYAYSVLSFEDAFFADHFHLLRAFALEHREAAKIAAACG